MATFNLDWDNTPIVGVSNVINQRVSYRIPEISNNPGGTSTWTTTGLTPSNPLPKTANTASFTGLANVLYQVKVEALCTEGGPTIGSNGIQEAVVFSCLTPTISPFTNENEDGSTQLQYGLNVIGTDIDQIRVILRKTIGNNVVGDQTVSASQVGTTYIVFSGLQPNTSYYAQTISFAQVNEVDVESTTICNSTGSSTSLPALGNPNLEFSWAKNTGESVDLTYDFNLGKGFDGSFSTIDWGDGTVNALRTHTYSTSSDFTVRVSNSNATNIYLSGQSVTSITKVPSTTQLLNAIGHLISSLGSLVAPNLRILSLPSGLLNTMIDFTDMPKIQTLNLSLNQLTGYLDLSLIDNLDSLSASNNMIDGHSPLAQHPGLRYINLQQNQITGMPNFTANPLLETINYTSNLISGTVNVTTNPNLQYLYFTGNTIPTPPNLSNNHDLRGIGFGSCSMVGILNLSANPLISNLILFNNQLTDIVGMENAQIFTTDIQNNKIPSSRINPFIISVNAKNMSGYVFYAQGQTPSAPLTDSAAITAKTALISRSYAVGTD